MTRASLTQDIKVLDQRLTVQRTLLRQRSVRSMQTLEQVNPLWLVGLGLIAGLLSGRLGLRGAFTVGSMGFRAQRVMQAAAYNFTVRPEE
ncbi:hypothetical protein [Ketobacter sp.]